MTICNECGRPDHSLDDWVNGQPDAWDYEAVLRGNRVRVLYDAQYEGWALTWEHGTMCIGCTDETLARKASALFVELWLRGVSASFADKLLNGYLMWEEINERSGLPQ